MGNWDKVAHLLDTSSHEVPPQVEDNLRVAWPTLTRQLTKNIDDPNIERIRVLDFGCGPGGLARSLAALGFEVLGVDITPGMIERAEKHKNGLTTFILGSFQDIPTAASFHGIVASMAFQFVPDLETCLARLTGHLLPLGIFTFAVFNPDFVAKDEPGIFSSMEDKVNLKLAEEYFPVTAIWNAERYRNVLEGLGYKILYSKLHAFPEGAEGAPEYLIMTFKKTA